MYLHHFSSQVFVKCWKYLVNLYIKSDIDITKSYDITDKRLRFTEISAIESFDHIPLITVCLYALHTNTQTMKYLINNLSIYSCTYNEWVQI